MDFRIIKTVIAREYITRVKKKSFFITTLLVPFLFAGFFVVMFLVMGNMKERKQNVAVVDQSGIVLSYLEDSDQIKYTDYTGQEPDSVKAHLSDYEMDVLVAVSPLDTLGRTVSVNVYSKDPVGVEFSEKLSRKVDNAVEAYRINLYNIEDLENIMNDVKAHVKVTEYTLDEKGNENISESGIYMVLSMLLGIIIFMFITLFGGQVMSSVIEEKTSRVVEVLISSVKAVDLMFGKIIGVAMVALTQFLLWIVLTVVLVGGVSFVMGKDVFKKVAENPAMMAQTKGMPVDVASLGLTAEAPVAPALDADSTALVAAGDSTVLATADSSAVDVKDTGEVFISTMSNIPWVRLLVFFLVFFILGYLLYASLFAAVGSAVENEGDASQLQIPITIPLMIAYMIVFVAFQNPDSALVVWGSMIPFTSPIVMLARIPYGVPMWQLLLSSGLLLLTFIGCAWISAKIYSAGILMFGKKNTFKDLWKWLRQ